MAIRVKHSPNRENRRSRFFGSHTGAAWLVLAMISGVMITLLLYRAAQVNTGNFPYGWWAFASHGLANALKPLGTGVNSVIETVALLANIAIITGFLVFVSYSKHLHIFLAPINVATSRRPRALGALASTPDMSMEDVGDDDEVVFGAGRIEDFSWKQLLDMATCTECGRCQSQCPAWNTGKPLSPKLLIMDLRDNLFASADRVMAKNRAAGVEVENLVPSVIDPDVLWSCTTCGACVEQCPVDIEHIDTIIDMRRYEVLMESKFPTEAGLMLRNIENQGDPWGLGAVQAHRLDRRRSTSRCPVISGTIPDDIEYLYWVGCAGALDERARKGAQATARMLHRAGVSFGILGPKETLHRRPGPPAGQRVPLPGAGPDEHRDPGRRRGQEGHRHLPPLLQLAGQRVPVPRRQLRGHPPQPAPRPPGHRGQADPRRRVPGHGHLPRPLLPGPPQPGVRRAPFGHRRHPRGHPGRDEALPREGVLLRCRRGPHVARGEHRQAGQHGADRGGHRDRRRRGVDRLPLLHDHARRRRAGQRQRGRRPGPRPLPAAGGVDGRAGRGGRGRRSPRSPWPARPRSAAGGGRGPVRRQSKAGVGVAQPAGHGRQHLAGDGRHRLQQSVELALGEHQQVHLRLGHHRGRPGPPVEQGQLAEVAARTEGGHLLALRG